MLPYSADGGERLTGGTGGGPVDCGIMRGDRSRVKDLRVFRLKVGPEGGCMGGGGGGGGGGMLASGSSIHGQVTQGHSQ